MPHDETDDTGWGDRLADAHEKLRGLVGTAVRSAVLDDLGPTAEFAEQMREHCEVACGYLHGHHTAEDSAIFPHLATTHPELGAILDRLTAAHRDIGARLVRIEEQAPAGDPETLHRELVELETLLDGHFSEEERAIVGPLNALGEDVPWAQ
ncbi:hemerythrin domain-containing protein [Microbacterium karelineae]|uniref:hemerythrin domain-containing protein n=1 Tax=Microbacterium karelineae TaxID=2654283 RepID=UPI0012EAB92E|nr:hemerythrin domain-containing protein [Microbacterium karelineae]